jgi:hypothetical protein
MIRNLEFKDYFNFEKLIKKSGQFPLVHLDNYLYPIKKVVEINGKIMGSAILHRTSEVSLVLDSDLSNFSKAKAIMEFFALLPNELERLHLEDTHVFVTPESGEKYCDSLKKHFGFREATGKALYLQI